MVEQSVREGKREKGRKCERERNGKKRENIEEKMWRQKTSSLYKKHLIDTLIALRMA